MEPTRPGHIPILMTLFLSLSFTAGTEATEKIGEQEEIDCGVCHLDPEQGAETLTDQGLYYQYMRTMDGCQLVLERFESCTYCHVDQAGDDSLTRQGHRFRWMMEDMAGLRAWLEENHPRPPHEKDDPDTPED